MKLLGFGDSSPKTTGADEHGIESAIMYLAPANESGNQVCASSTAGCRKVCLYSQGRGRMTKVQEARIRKTRLFFDKREQFLSDLTSDIASVERRALKKFFQPVVRLNGTSDIRWERHGIIQQFPTVQIYDYTKHKNRRGIPDNYHLTFSYSEETTLDDVDTALNHGMNIAAVFRHELPDTWHGLPVIDGTLTDWRFRDPSPCIVGLKAKGSAKHDTSGFVLDI